MYENESLDFLQKVKSNQIDVVKSMIGFGADLGIKDANGSTPLHWAARNLDFEMVKILLEAGADVNANNKELITPLHFATKFKSDMSNSLKVVELLLENRANPLAQDDLGATPLHWAVYINLIDVIRKLAETGEVVHVKEIMGFTPLHCAQSKEVVKILLENGADLNAINETGATPLHEATSAEVAKELILSGADINSEDNNGSTPLHLANNVDVARVLIESGADLNSKDNNGLTPLKIAELNELDDMVKYLSNEVSENEDFYLNINRDDYVKKLNLVNKKVLDILKSYSITASDKSRIKEEILTTLQLPTLKPLKVRSRRVNPSVQVKKSAAYPVSANK